MRNQDTEWWIFYPMKGIEIADDEHDLDNPMFGDATIISLKHIPLIVKRYKFNERGAPGHDHERDIIFLIEHSAFHVGRFSLLAVKRTKANNLSKTQDQPKDRVNIQDIEQSSQWRASQVTAAVSLALLECSTDWTTCGLIKQVDRRQHRVVMLSSGTTDFVYYNKGGEQSRTIDDDKKVVTLARADLLTKLYSGCCSGLSSVLLSQNPPLPSTLVRTVTQSAIRLSEALHMSSTAGQLLGAVTSIEMLVADQGDSYDTLKDRIMALIGREVYESFDVSRILHERHQYVHKGIAPSPERVATKATALALACLLRYIEASSKLMSKNTLVTYLDFIILGWRLVNEWSPDQLEAFKSLINHTADGYGFLSTKEVTEGSLEFAGNSRESSVSNRSG